MRLRPVLTLMIKGECFRAHRGDVNALSSPLRPGHEDLPVSPILAFAVFLFGRSYLLRCRPDLRDLMMRELTLTLICNCKSELRPALEL